MEEVEYAGRISASNEQEWDSQYAQEQQRLWRQMNAYHWLGLIASPLIGIVLSATLWSCYEVLIGRNRFPTQPGHWVLLAMAVILAFIWIREWLRPLIDRRLNELIPTAIACLLIAGIAIKNLIYVRWTLAFASLSIGSAAMAGAALIMWTFNAPFVSLLIVGMLLVGCFPVFVLLCLLVDLSQQRRFDIFHWIGIGTLGGLVACFVVWFTQIRAIS
jgi:hypothetical protein